MSLEPKLLSLVYVSESRLARPADSFEISKIVEVSRARNAGLGVAGALIATHRFFAQILEGPPLAVEDLMLSIGRDARHAIVTVVRREPISRSRFVGWSMAYSGPSGYVERDIAPLFHPPIDLSPTPGTDRLIRLFRAFVAPGGA